MFAPSIKVDFDKLKQEEDLPEKSKTAKAKAAPRARAGARKPAAEAVKDAKD
jgi:hypothetical protein